MHEVADWYGLPYEATRGGAETLYPEYRKKMGKPEHPRDQMRALLFVRRRRPDLPESHRRSAGKTTMTRDHSLYASLLVLCAAGANSQQQNFDNVQIHVEPVQHNIYMLVGAGGNTTVQVGSEGVLMVDTQFAPLAPKLMAEIRKLSPGPLRYIINTHMHPDHVGGNAAIAKLAGSDPALPLKIIAHENVLNRLTATDARPAAFSGSGPADRRVRNAHEEPALQR